MSTISSLIEVFIQRVEEHILTTTPISEFRKKAATKEIEVAMQDALAKGEEFTGSSMQKILQYHRKHQFFVDHVIDEEKELLEKAERGELPIEETAEVYAKLAKRKGWTGTYSQFVPDILKTTEVRQELAKNKKLETFSELCS